MPIGIKYVEATYARHWNDELQFLPQFMVANILNEAWLKLAYNSLGGPYIKPCFRSKQSFVRSSDWSGICIAHSVAPTGQAMGQ